MSVWCVKNFDDGRDGRLSMHTDMRERVGWGRGCQRKGEGKTRERGGREKQSFHNFHSN